MGVVLVFEVTNDVDGRLSFTSEDANRIGLPQTRIARHGGYLDNSNGGNKLMKWIERSPLSRYAGQKTYLVSYKLPVLLGHWAL
jgi:hypothetical protein